MTGMSMFTSSAPSTTASPRRRRARVAALSVAAMVAFAPLAAACSSESTAATAVVTDDTVLIDVRTPAEFATGHLEGAVNIDVQAPDFDARVAELDPNGTYLVYCRSGNRSGQAIDRMQAMGFTELTNIGSVAEANAATGVPVVS